MPQRGHSCPSVTESLLTGEHEAWQHPYVNVFKLCDTDQSRDVDVMGDVTEHMVSSLCGEVNGFSL